MYIYINHSNEILYNAEAHTFSLVWMIWIYNMFLFYNLHAVLIFFILILFLKYLIFLFYGYLLMEAVRSNISIISELLLRVSSETVCASSISDTDLK